ncbi:MAG: hypothetical protein K8S20_17440 [Chloroflexi bacterium]|nr:hypothetical protein [Chloroflexota bacterium]
MRTLGRILALGLVFSVVTALIVIIVNASGANAPGFGDGPQFRPGGGGGEGFRPPFDGNRPGQGREEGREAGEFWLLGPIKNVAVIGLLVTAIVWPRSIARKNRKRLAP